LLKNKAFPSKKITSKFGKQKLMKNKYERQFTQVCGDERNEIIFDVFLFIMANIYLFC
jgi:hypothetical protein